MANFTTGGYAPSIVLTIYSYKKLFEAMASLLEAIEEAQVRALLLRVLAWRVGDLDDLPKKICETYSVSESDALELLERLCLPLDVAIALRPESVDQLLQGLKMSASEEVKRKLASATFEIREKAISFVLEHAPSLSRVLYHDWKIETQIATESLGRIARPVASITLRVQPAAKGSDLLPPLESVSMELAKDMVDALSSGFDRLQTQLSKIVQ